MSSAGSGYELERSAIATCLVVAVVASIAHHALCLILQGIAMRNVRMGRGYNAGAMLGVGETKAAVNR